MREMVKFGILHRLFAGCARDRFEGTLLAMGGDGVFARGAFGERLGRTRRGAGRWGKTGGRMGAGAGRADRWPGVRGARRVGKPEQHRVHRDPSAAWQADVPGRAADRPQGDCQLGTTPPRAATSAARPVGKIQASRAHRGAPHGRPGASGHARWRPDAVGVSGGLVHADQHGRRDDDPAVDRAAGANLHGVSAIGPAAMARGGSRGRQGANPHFRAPASGYRQGAGGIGPGDQESRRVPGRQESDPGRKRP